MKKRALLRWRMLLGVGVLAALVAPLTATGGGSAKVSTKDDATQRLADLYRIDQIEVKFHRATSKHDLNLMMSLWAPNGTLSLGGKTVKGKPAIRAIFSKAGPFQPQNKWVSETPAYKIRTTVVGKRATLYFECHYVDVDTGKVVLVNGISQDLQKINGKWLITKTVGSSPILEP